MDAFTLTMVTAVAAGVGAILLSEITALPSIVFLLILGVVLGEGGLGLVDPSVFGHTLPAAVRLAVAIILFEGALSLNIKQLRAAATGPIRNLLSVGALITWLGSALAAHAIAGLSWSVSLLFGSIVIVTGPTVIQPLLRRVRVRPRLATILRWEGVLIDPIGAVVAIVILEYLLALEPSLTATLWSFASVLLAGVAVGLPIGLLSGLALRRRAASHPVDEESSGNLLALAMALLAYGLAEHLLHEGGIVAATTVGFTLANFEIPAVEELKKFGGQVSNLIVALLFVILAAGTDLGQLAAVRTPLFLVVGAVALLVRPINIFASTIGSGLSWREKLFLSWISPRGIVAASVASLFAVSLPADRYPGSELIEPLVFLTIALTVLIQGLTANSLARWLGVEEPERRGYLLVGAHPFGIALGKALTAAKVPVLLIDSNLRNCIRARREGLKVFKGNALDATFLERVITQETGTLLAITENDEVNALVTLAARSLLGGSGTWRLVTTAESNVAQGKRAGRLETGRIAFAETTNVHLLSEQIDVGGRTVGFYEPTSDLTVGPDPSAHPEQPFPLLRFDGMRAEALGPGDVLRAGEESIALLADTSASEGTPTDEGAHAPDAAAPR